MKNEFQKSELETVPQRHLRLLTWGSKLNLKVNDFLVKIQPFQSYSLLVPSKWEFLGWFHSSVDEICIYSYMFLFEMYCAPDVIESSCSLNPDSVGTCWYGSHMWKTCLICYLNYRKITSTTLLISFGCCIASGTCAESNLLVGYYICTYTWLFNWLSPLFC